MTGQWQTVLWLASDGLCTMTEWRKRNKENDNMIMSSVPAGRIWWIRNYFTFRIRIHNSGFQEDLANVAHVRVSSGHDLRVMIDTEGPLSKFSTFDYRGSSHRHKSAAWHLIVMVGYIARYFARSNDFYLPSRRIEGGGCGHDPSPK